MSNTSQPTSWLNTLRSSKERPEAIFTLVFVSAENDDINYYNLITLQSSYTMRIFGHTAFITSLLTNKFNNERRSAEIRF